MRFCDLFAFPTTLKKRKSPTSIILEIFSDSYFNYSSSVVLSPHLSASHFCFKILSLDCSFYIYHLWLIDVGIYFDRLSDSFWTPKDSERSQGRSPGGICCIWFSMGSGCLCTDTTEQESNPVVNQLGTRAPWCILAEFTNTTCFSQHPEACGFSASLRTDFLLHDPHCFRAIISKSWRSGEGRPLPQTSGRTVSLLIFRPIYRWNPSSLLSSNIWFFFFLAYVYWSIFIPGEIYYHIIVCMVPIFRWFRMPWKISDAIIFHIIFCRKLIKSFIQGYIPGLVLKIFLYFLPDILMILSKVEGYLSLSSLERKTASKYYYFMLVNVFLGSIIAGTAFEQLYSFLHQSATQ